MIYEAKYNATMPNIIGKNKLQIIQIMNTYTIVQKFKTNL